MRAHARAAPGLQPSVKRKYKPLGAKKGGKVSKLTRQCRNEWTSLKEHLSRLDGKESDGDVFKWQLSKQDSLVLGDVAVSFHDGKDIGLHVQFSRSAPESENGVSPVLLVAWFLDPSIEVGTVVWMFASAVKSRTPRR